MLSHHKSIAVSKTIVGGKLEMENSNVLQEKKNPLTEGDIFPALIRFALPVLGALFLQSLYGAVDLLVVGKFSASSDVSAVSNGAQIMATLTNVLAAFAMGTTVLIGQLTGQKNREEAGRTVGVSLVFFSVLGIALSIVMMIFAPQAAHIMKVPREAFPAAVSYLRSWHVPGMWPETCCSLRSSIWVPPARQPRQWVLRRCRFFSPSGCWPDGSFPSRSGGICLPGTARGFGKSSASGHRSQYRIFWSAFLSSSFRQS